MTQVCKRLMAVALVGAAVLWLSGDSRTHAQLPQVQLPNLLNSVVRVEEDWKLVVSTPNQQVASPQVATQMKRAPSSSRFCNLHLNACDIPSLSLGGMQLQVWKDDTNLANKTSDNNAIMNTPNEEVTWTQYLKQSNGQLKFGVSAASSQTWGDFSGLEITYPNGQTNLNNYDVNYSVQNSGVTFGANRVTVFKLTAVRVYYSDGTVQTDSTERIVYAAPQDQTGN